MFKIKVTLFGLLISFISGTAINLAFCYLCAKILYYNRSAVSIALIIVTIVSSFLGGLIAALMSKEKVIIYGIINGVIILMCLFIYSAIVYGIGGGIKSIMRFILTIPASTIGSIVSLPILGRRQYI